MSHAHGTKHAESHHHPGPGGVASGGTWQPFYVTNASNQQDGQINFTYTITSVNGVNTLAAGATLVFANDNNPTPPPASQQVTLFTTTNAIPVNNDGTYSLPAVTFSTKVHIRHIGNGNIGGDYDTLGNLVFNPTTTPITITGQFVSTGPATDPDPCDWESDVGN